jgi:hypothetical protein
MKFKNYLQKLLQMIGRRLKIAWRLRPGAILSFPIPHHSSVKNLNFPGRTGREAFGRPFHWQQLIMKLLQILYKVSV